MDLYDTLVLSVWKAVGQDWDLVPFYLLGLLYRWVLGSDREAALRDHCRHRLPWLNGQVPNRGTASALEARSVGSMDGSSVLSRCGSRILV